MTGCHSALFMTYLTIPNIVAAVINVQYLVARFGLYDSYSKYQRGLDVTVQGNLD
jgi:hypothetical protein